MTASLLWFDVSILPCVSARPVPSILGANLSFTVCPLRISLLPRGQKAMLPVKVIPRRCPRLSHARSCQPGVPSSTAELPSVVKRQPGCGRISTAQRPFRGSAGQGVYFHLLIYILVTSSATLFEIRPSRWTLRVLNGRASQPTRHRARGLVNAPSSSGFWVAAPCFPDQ
jgi:hypothetical protein